MKSKGRFRAVVLTLAVAILGLFAVASPAGAASADPQPETVAIPDNCGPQTFGPAINPANGLVFFEIDLVCDFFPPVASIGGQIRSDIGPIITNFANCDGRQFCALLLQVPCQSLIRYQGVYDMVFLRADGSSQRFQGIVPPVVGVTLC